jgi:hypothetical protein
MDLASPLLQLLPSARRLPGLRELVNSAETYLPAEQVARIRQAAEFGAEAHEGQKRIRWPRRRSSRTCISTRTRSSRPSCMM